MGREVAHAVVGIVDQNVAHHRQTHRRSQRSLPRSSSPSVHVVGFAGRHLIPAHDAGHTLHVDGTYTLIATPRLLCIDVGPSISGNIGSGRRDSCHRAGNGDSTLDPPNARDKILVLGFCGSKIDGGVRVVTNSSERRRVVKEFGRKRAVDSVSFAVRRGEILGFLGPNGAGKTTTMRMIMGITAPDQGRITYHVDGRQENRVPKERVGYLPEERGLYKEARVMDVLLFLAGLKGMDKKTARARSMEWLERFGLKEYAFAKVQQLSGHGPEGAVHRLRHPRSRPRGAR